MARNSALKKLPEPMCELGYPYIQLEEIFGDRMDDFNRFMRGQTIAMCEGQVWDYQTKEYKLTGCGPHGFVVYRSDVHQFILGGPPLD